MGKEAPTCKVCDQGQLKKKTKYRMSTPVVLIGQIFLIPSIIGMLIGVLLFIFTLVGTTDTVNTGGADTGGVLVVSGVISVFVIICSFVGGLLGWLLTMKKKVLKCNSCGAVVDAS